ncbi:MAG TPA: Gfo/Idh/MocA family oxidoreductase [Gemmataceae bacterium]|jgi:predicted dehydrogenase|nr:Gfo/Idh/MocA family oxidoreductase [Gemmataceae bacterium]
MSNLSRRGFLGASAAATLPAWFLEECQAQPDPKTPTLKNDKPGIALVGCGGQGTGDLRNAARFGSVVALCDVDEGHVENAGKAWPMAAKEHDFRKIIDRKDVDVVVCGTVDHWHTLVSLAAMRAGKDVYCEKPLTLTVDEGKRLVEAQAKTKRLLQTGSQQRSDKNFRLAVELVRNGRLGKIKEVDVWLPAGRKEGPFKTAAVPKGFDWDLWQGPTPAVEYVQERTHVTFRYWWDYSGGTMTDWGAHHNDIARWALDQQGPVKISGKPTVEMIPGGFTAASEYGVEYTYADGVVHRCRSTAANNWFGGVVDPKGQQHGIKFHGTDGWIFVTRGKIEVSDPDLLKTPLPASATRVTMSNDHMGNFFECVRTRKLPICDAEVGHRSASICHLGVIAMRLGKELKWDPAKEEFNDKEANKWLAREPRKPWSYDAM